MDAFVLYITLHQFGLFKCQVLHGAPGVSPAEDNKGAGTSLLHGNVEGAGPVQSQELTTERGPLQHL